MRGTAKVVGGLGSSLAGIWGFIIFAAIITMFIRLAVLLLAILIVVMLVRFAAQGVRRARNRRRVARTITRESLRNDAERAAWDQAYRAELARLNRPQAHYSSRR